VRRQGELGGRGRGGGGGGRDTRGSRGTIYIGSDVQRYLVLGRERTHSQKYFFKFLFSADVLRCLFLGRQCTRSQKYFFSAVTCLVLGRPRTRYIQDTSYYKLI